MITIQLGELRVIADGLKELLTKELPVKPAYWLGKLAKQINQELQETEENRLKLAEKYALRDADGKPLVQDDRYQFGDNEAQFTTELLELWQTEIKLDFRPIALETLGDIKLSPVVLMGLEKFLELTVE